MLHRIACAAVLAMSAPAFALAQDSTAADTQPPSASASQASPVTSQTVLATIGDTDITVGNLIAAKGALPDQFQQMPLSVLFSGLLNQLINQELLKQSFNGVVPEGVQVSLDNSRRSMMAAVALGDYLDSTITEDMITAKYNEMYGDGYEPEEEYHASHILVETEDEAKDLIKQYNDGVDFAKLARDNSTGPTGANGGDLGWFTAEQMIPAFSNAVKEMEVGQISEPVHTDFGWHVILLQDTRKQAPELDQVRGEIIQQLQEDLTTQYIDELTANADVDKSGADQVDPASLDTITLE